MSDDEHDCEVENLSPRGGRNPETLDGIKNKIISMPNCRGKCTICKQKRKYMKINTIRKIVNMARNDPASLDEFLASLKGQTSED